MKKFFDVLAVHKDRIERDLRESLDEMGAKTVLKEACEYILCSGGKRFRPTIVHMVAAALGKGFDVSKSALAVEFFHTASLIADDFPCMDNEAHRRGQPTLHVVYGETVALLTTYALIAEGYGLIGKNGVSCGCESRLLRTQLALESASKNTGICGATGGQFFDLYPQERTLEALSEMIRLKTVTLFELSFVFGWLFGGGDIARLTDVKQVAHHWGFAFQIADDFSDYEQDGNRFCNMARELGLEAAFEVFSKHLEALKKGLDDLGMASEGFLTMITALEENALAVKTRAQTNYASEVAATASSNADSPVPASS